MSFSPCEGQELNLGVLFSLILLSRCKQQVAALFDLYEFRVCFGLVQVSLYVSDAQDGKKKYCQMEFGCNFEMQFYLQSKTHSQVKQLFDKCILQI